MIGASWREADTQAIAKNLVVSGFDVFHPRVDWRGAGDGSVECEFPLYQLVVASLLAVCGESEWPGRLVSLVSLVVIALSAFRLYERRCGSVPAAVGVAAFLVGNQAVLVGTRVMPDALSGALSLLGALAFTGFLASGRTRSLAVACVVFALGVLAKPTSLQLLPLAFCAVTAEGRPSWRCRRLWLGAACVLAAVGVWVLHARALGLTSGLTFGVTFGDTKTPHLEHLLRLGLYRDLFMTTMQYGLSWLGAVAFLVLTVRRRLDFGDMALVSVVAAGLLGTMRYSCSAGMGPQYHLVAAIAGGWFVARAWPVSARVWLWAIALGVLGASAVRSVTSEMEWRRNVAQAQILQVAAELRASSSPDDLVVVRGAKVRFDVFWRRPNNFEEPVLLYQSGRRGWVLPADGVEVDVLDRLLQQGADWYVAPDGPVGVGVDDWLRRHGADAIRVGGCSIHRLRARRRFERRLAMRSWRGR